jgi:hypothetical protein
MKTVYTIALLFAIVGMSAFMSENPKLFKNLKVLPKDITKPELDSVMKSFTAGLGVKCTFCHVRNSEGQWFFDLDTNPNKLIARKMFVMTKKIDKKYFIFSEREKEKMEQNQTELHQIVTCYTCHRGSNKPLQSPPPIKKD